MFKQRPNQLLDLLLGAFLLSTVSIALGAAIGPILGISVFVFFTVLFLLGLARQERSRRRRR